MSNKNKRVITDNSQLVLKDANHHYRVTQQLPKIAKLPEYKQLREHISTHKKEHVKYPRPLGQLGPGPYGSDSLKETKPIVKCRVENDLNKCFMTFAKADLRSNVVNDADYAQHVVKCILGSSKRPNSLPKEYSLTVKRIDKASKIRMNIVNKGQRALADMSTHIKTLPFGTDPSIPFMFLCSFKYIFMHALLVDTNQTVEEILASMPYFNDLNGQIVDAYYNYLKMPITKTRKSTAQEVGVEALTLKDIKNRPTSIIYTLPKNMSFTYKTQFIKPPRLDPFMFVDQKSYVKLQILVRNRQLIDLDICSLATQLHDERDEFKGQFKILQRAITHFQVNKKPERSLIKKVDDFDDLDEYQRILQLHPYKAYDYKSIYNVRQKYNIPVSSLKPVRAMNDLCPKKSLVNPYQANERLYKLIREEREKIDFDKANTIS